jgi:hypothetical protein
VEAALFAEAWVGSVLDTDGAADEASVDGVAESAIEKRDYLSFRLESDIKTLEFWKNFARTDAEAPAGRRAGDSGC